MSKQSHDLLVWPRLVGVAEYINNHPSVESVEHSGLTRNHYERRRRHRYVARVRYVSWQDGYRWVDGVRWRTRSRTAVGCGATSAEAVADLDAKVRRRLKATGT
jgi:hypothetical protein